MASTSIDQSKIGTTMAKLYLSKALWRHTLSRGVAYLCEAMRTLILFLAVYRSLFRNYHT